MDGKGRALDNIFIERFWRTIKYQHIYLNPADEGITLYRGIKNDWKGIIIKTIKALTKNLLKSLNMLLKNSTNNQQIMV